MCLHTSSESVSPNARHSSRVIATSSFRGDLPERRFSLLARLLRKVGGRARIRLAEGAGFFLIKASTALASESQLMSNHFGDVRSTRTFDISRKCPREINVLKSYRQRRNRVIDFVLLSIAKCDRKRRDYPIGRINHQLTAKRKSHVKFFEYRCKGMTSTSDSFVRLSHGNNFPMASYREEKCVCSTFFKHANLQKEEKERTILKLQAEFLTAYDLLFSQCCNSLNI